jgi:hypothetical protein
MGQNEIIYLIGTEPQSVWSSTLQKYGKDWDLMITSVNYDDSFDPCCCTCMIAQGTDSIS